MQAECPRPASEKARPGSVCLLPRSEDVGFPSWGGGVTQPCVSPGLFLAPKPLLRSGCEYRSPLPVLWLWPSARTLLCAWTGGRPAPCLPPPSAGIWANSPTPKKVPPILQALIRAISIHDTCSFVPGPVRLTAWILQPGRLKHACSWTLNQL